MKPDVYLKELIETLKNVPPEFPVETLRSLIDSGKPSPFVAKRSFQPRRIKSLLIPLKFLVMMAPIIILSGLLIIVNPLNDSPTNIKKAKKLPAAQINLSKQSIPGSFTRPVEIIQQGIKEIAEIRNEPELKNDIGMVKLEPIFSSGVTSKSNGIMFNIENSLDSLVSEDKTEQKILRVNIDFFQKMGVEVSEDSFSVLTKDTSASIRENGSILARHVFKRSAVTSYDNWTDTIWEPGEEIPTLAAITNFSGLFSLSFTGETYSPQFTDREINRNSIEMCVAVSLISTDTLSPLFGSVFWYYPNEKFFSCLPWEIAKPLKNEFNYQFLHLDSTFSPLATDRIGLGNGEREMDSEDIKKETVQCVYFTNLCESLPGLDLVNLFPNPATDQICIDLVIQTAKKIQFQIVDLGGKVVSVERSQTNYPQKGQFIHQLNISNLQAGLYLLIMTDDTGARLTRRFVKN